MLKKIAVTGITGTIGIALVEECIKQNIEVYALCRKGSDRNKDIPCHPLIHVLECSLDELADFDESKLQGAEVFYHMAWIAPIGEGRNDMRLQLDNVRYTLDAVGLAKRAGCTTFVGTGSQAEYGPVNEKLSANTPTSPVGGYGIAKLCASQMSRIECEKLGLNYIWTRILSVYGPNSGEMGVIPVTAKKLLEGEVPLLTKGEQQWDYIYSGDTARALLLMGEKGVDGKIYCLGSGETRPFIEYIKILRDKINPDIELGIGALPYNENQVMYLCADIEELCRDTGFVPQVTFEEGIEKTIEWVKKRMIG